MIMKAHELIDSPEKWANSTQRLSDERMCAYTAICAVYGALDPEPVLNRVKRYISWNDSSNWLAVYNTLKHLDI